MVKPVLITGAAGRIGGHLLRWLPDLGWEVRGCDRTASDGVMAADITRLDDICRAVRGCGVIIHLAATPNAKPGWDVVNRLNVHGTRCVLEAARIEGVRQVVFASSIHTIGALPADTPLGPDLPPAPSGIYGVSKLAAEGLLQVYAMKTRMRAISVRICSYRPEPGNLRELRTWLGYDDTLHLFDRCLRDRTPGYQMIWGVSANTRLRIDDPTARRIGYAPTQDAEDYAPAITDGVQAPLGSEPWALMGGPVADDMTTDFCD